MKKNTPLNLIVHLSDLQDPRSGDNIRHSLVEILFIAICAVICGCEHWTEMEDFGHAKKEWLSKFLKLKGGIPSHDTFRRIFCILNFEHFQEVFIEWTDNIRKTLKIEKDQICIDGKTLRASACRSKSIKAIHMVNAWSTSLSLSLGQIPTEEKSNEITAIPELLDLLDIKDCLVSIDAMGCQRDIADKIISSGGDYLFGLKGNQKGLCEASEELFRRNSTAVKTKLSADDFSEEKTNSHGRVERRKCRVLYLEDEVEFFPHEKWPSIKCLIRVKSFRKANSSSEMSREIRYYISSAKKGAEEFNRSVRSHWQIENKLHWSLDVAMNEDRDQKWAENSAKNYALLRQMALNLLRKESSKLSLRRKQKIAAMDNEFLIKVFTAI